MNPENAYKIIRDWIDCILHPCVQITEHLVHHDKNFNAIAKLWYPSIFLSIIVNYPILKWYNVEIYNATYYIIQQTITFFAIFMYAIISHVFMRIARVKSEFNETMIMYTIVVIYTPITAAISLPESYKWYDYIRQLKISGNADLGKAFMDFAQHDFMVGDKYLSLSNFVLYSTGFIFLISLVAFAEFLVQRYRAPKFRTYVAVATASFVIAAAHRWVEIPLQSLMAYIYMV